MLYVLRNSVLGIELEERGENAGREHTLTPSDFHAYEWSVTTGENELVKQ